jgi:hypothetical protein
MPELTGVILFVHQASGINAGSAAARLVTAGRGEG